MEECSFRFPAERKKELVDMLFQDRLLPEFDLPIQKVSYLDGCKVYFQSGEWIIARFSGTEPLLRIFCEMENREKAQRYCGLFKEFLGL